jgi:hypothetical protein
MASDNISTSDLFVNTNSDPSGFRELSRFNGYFDNRYVDDHPGGSAFIFVTKPMLFILPTKPSAADSRKDYLAYGNMTKDPKFAQFLVKESGGNDEDGYIAKMLSYKEYTDVQSLFLPIFTNRTITFDSQDVSLDTEDAFNTKEGYRIPMPGTKTQSEAAGNIAIGMLPDTLNLDMIKIMTLWVNYISYISNGTFDANPDMVRNCQLDYMSSIYYFVLNPDGKTLKYWCKYTGCYPTSIPYSALSYSRGDGSPQNITVQMAYTVKEDLSPRILEDFNKVSLRVADCWDDSSSAASEDDSGSGEYIAGSTSPLLSEKALSQNSGLMAVINSAKRDPIVFRVPKKNASDVKSSNSDAIPAHFELSFGRSTMASSVIKSVTGNNTDGLIDYDSFWKSPLES